MPKLQIPGFVVVEIEGREFGLKFEWSQNGGETIFCLDPKGYYGGPWEARIVSRKKDELTATYVLIAARDSMKQALDNHTTFDRSVELELETQIIGLIED